MISKLKIKNFKSFNEAEFEFGQFNLLCGTNSSGKTSVIHALVMLIQNASSKKGNDASINGQIVQLGSFSEIKNFKNKNKNPIVISGVNNNKKFNLEMILDENDTKKTIINEIENLDSFTYENNIYYLSANRIGNIELHEASNNNMKFGSFGEHTINYLLENSEKFLDLKFVFDKTNSGAPTLLNEVNFWLEKIVGSNIRVDDVKYTSKTVATYANKNSEDFVRAINIGSGISYLISIIITCFGVCIESNKNSSTLIIENPEIHLHPKAQSMLTEFLVFMSSSVQIIIETQSDHVFNKYRISLKNRLINISTKDSHVYFMIYENQETRVTRIDFTNDGRVVNNQQYLFNQFDEDILKLLERD